MKLFFFKLNFHIALVKILDTQQLKAKKPKVEQPKTNLGAEKYKMEAPREWLFKGQEGKNHQKHQKPVTETTPKMAPIHQPYKTST